jgi:hypothetical protein
MPAKILMKYELARVGDLVGPGVRYISEGNLQPGMEKLEPSTRLGLWELAGALRAYPRPVLQILLGRVLWHACRAGCGRVVAQRLGKHGSIYNR